MNQFETAQLMELLGRIAAALEKTNAMHEEPVEFKNPHGEIIQTAEQTERLIQVQEREARTRERQADAWEAHNRWHLQQGTPGHRAPTDITN